MQRRGGVGWRIALVGGVLGAATTVAQAHDEAPLSEFGLRPGVAVGPLIEVGGGFAAAATTARLREDPTVSASGVMEFVYRRRTELAGGRALLIGGELSLVRGFTAERRGGATFASAACTAGTVRHDEEVALDLNQAGIFFSAEFRQPLGADWFTEVGAGAGLYRVVATTRFHHHEWCAQDTPAVTTAFGGFDAREFAYVPGVWFGANLGWRLHDTVPILDLRLTLRVYLVDGFALRLRSQTDPRTIDLHVQPSYGVAGLSLVLTF